MLKIKRTYIILICHFIFLNRVSLSLSVNTFTDVSAAWIVYMFESTSLPYQLCNDDSIKKNWKKKLFWLIPCYHHSAFFGREHLNFVFAWSVNSREVKMMRIECQRKKDKYAPVAICEIFRWNVLHILFFFYFLMFMFIHFSSNRKIYEFFVNRSDVSRVVQNLFSLISIFHFLRGSKIFGVCLCQCQKDLFA